ncbi:hypothetical protein PQX77_001389 [Marasmius sp. AFHP31]|nr:hypothetical protein PQX77_001389 [Marasmius sp. AFHP31]
MFKLFALLLALCVSVWGFQNPIKSRDGSDPFMVYHEGYYYLTSTTWNNIQLTRATTVGGLKTATPKVIWTDSTASRCCNMWAPEIHWQSKEGSWYIYYTAGTTGTLDNQKLHVLKGSSNIIWDSSWSYAGRIAIPNRDVWAIDATVMVLGTTRYLVYSSWDGPDQCLWISYVRLHHLSTTTSNPIFNFSFPSQMNSATTVGNTVKISTPTLSWERVGSNVNEGPGKSSIPYQLTEAFD